MDPNTTHTLWIVGGVVGGVLLLLAWWVLRKGGTLAGDHVFRASRLSKGNHVFPAQVVITPSSLTLYRPQWIGKFEESIHMAHIASIKIDTHVIFADISIETSGGQDPVRSYGHTKGDAVEMKNVIEKFQTDYYKSNKT
jgi:hypothetical protein